jgi:VIT1/CCC1 family predicted Fe2+/Mn2+ transporter
MPETETGRRERSRPGEAADRLRRLSRVVASTLRAAAFWSAVVLPVVYLPMLFVDGGWSTSLVSGLLAVHVLAVLVGKGYDPGN